MFEQLTTVIVFVWHQKEPCRYFYKYKNDLVHRETKDVYFNYQYNGPQRGPYNGFMQFRLVVLPKRFAFTLSEEGNNILLLFL